MRLSTTVTVLLSAALLGGCLNPTQKSLRRAQKALEDCDLREAHGHFDEAYALSHDDVDAALGFALTDMVFLAEDPNITRALVALGAEGPIDVEAFLYGEGALLDRLASHGDCEALVEQTLPYAPLRDEDIDPLSLIDSDLTIEALLADLRKIDRRLARASRAFESAANQLEAPYTVELEGSCGGSLGPIALDAPELYGAAAMLDLLRAVIQAADGYDWDVTIHDLASEDDALIVETCNEHIGYLTDPDAVAEAGETLERALDLVDRGLDAALDAKPSPDVVFAWHRFDEGMIGELRALVGAARLSLQDDEFETIPYWTPELGANLGALFTAPPDAGTLDGPLFRLEQGYYSDYLEVSTRRLESLFEVYFDRDVFQSRDDEYLDVDWAQDLEPVFNPGGRYDELYCN
jgi:hypothetical protein